VRRELSPRALWPLFGLVMLLAAAVLALLFALAPTPGARHGAHARPAAPPPLIFGGGSSPTSSVPRISRGALVVGRRFLRLYAQLQTRLLDAEAAGRLRSLASLALARTLLAQPPQAAGGGHTPASLVHVRAERLSASAVSLHAAFRRHGALWRVRCLVQRDRGRWTVTALTAVA
jgi:hypothetical protein